MKSISCNLPDSIYEALQEHMETDEASCDHGVSTDLLPNFASAWETEIRRKSTGNLAAPPSWWLANSLPTAEPLRQRFLSASMIREILGAENQGRDPEKFDLAS